MSGICCASQRFGVQHEPVLVGEGMDLRFGASTRAFFLLREGPAAGAAKKRSVQWPDEGEGAGARLASLPANLTMCCIGALGPKLQ